MFATSLRNRSLMRQQRTFLFGAVLVMLGLISLIALNSTTPGPTLTGHSSYQQMELPLAFVPNAGQVDTDVQFQVHDLGGTIFFTAEEVVLSLPGAAAETDHLVRLQFAGNNEIMAIQTGKPLSGLVNYLIGDEPSAWLTDLPTYEGIVYKSLYPGIDLTYNGTNGRLKGTYMVAPGADPSLIRWRHAGAAGVSTDPAGNLIVALPDTTVTLTEQAPVAWQEINGWQQNVPVSYAIAADGAVHFSLGQYDHSLPLVIDPTIVYSAIIGGGAIEFADSIAVDSAGNTYITGSTFSTDYPTASPFQSNQGSIDVFVTKINAAGDDLVYSTYIGGNEEDAGNGIVVDASGKAYVTGDTASTDFPTASPVQAANGGMDDAFILALNAAGNGLVYSTYLGGNIAETAEDIALDGSGNVYVTGMTLSSNFPTVSAYDNTRTGVSDAFVTKLNSAGSAWVFSTYLGGSGGGWETGQGIAVDGSNAYVLGNTLSSDFPTNSAYQSSKAGIQDMFITKFSSDGGTLEYSTYLGGSGYEAGYSIDVYAGQAHVTGYTQSSNYPTHLPIQSTFAGGPEDAFVSVLSSAGSALEFSTFLGGGDGDRGHGIAVDGSGDIYLTGETFSTDFPTLNPAQATNNGNADAFIAKIDGGSLDYSSYYGGSATDHGDSITVGAAGFAYVVGLTSSSDFPGTSIGASPLGASDVFVLKVEDAGTGAPPTPTPTPGSGGSANLTGSRKHASQTEIGPGEDLTYTIRLHNSGTVDTTADVSDAIPASLNYVTGSVTGGGVYDAPTHTLTWDDVPVNSGDTVDLAFVVNHSVTLPELVINTAVITPDGGTSFDRSVPVLLTTSPSTADDTPPEVHSVVIDSKDVLTSVATTLSIDATDDVGVTEMNISEWQVTYSPMPRWERVNNSGWIPYASSTPWTLHNESGVHYITVRVADAAGNISVMSLNAVDYASLLLSGETVDRFHFVPYMVHYEAGESVTATLNPSAGDADLYVWYPHSFWLPDQKSANSGTAVDSVSFTAPREGTYLFLVHGYLDSTYNFSITPAGGPTFMASTMTAVTLQQAVVNTTASKDLITAEPIFSLIDLDPFGMRTTPNEWTQLYLPIVINN